MAENLKKLPDSSIENFSSETIDLTEKEMLKHLLEKQNEQDKINKELIDNQQKLIEKLQSIEDNQNGRKRKLDNSSSENPAKKVDSASPSENTNSSSGGKMQSSDFENFQKCFTLKQKFQNFSKLIVHQTIVGAENEHFGMNWKLSVVRQEDYLLFAFSCLNHAAIRVWSIETDIQLKMFKKNDESTSGNAFDEFRLKDMKMAYIWYNAYFKMPIEWNDLEEHYIVDGSMTFEVTFKIKNMTGIYKDDLRSFNDMECSDVVLIVQEKKFHVLKLYLATHSSYFRAMFLGMFSDSKKSEIPLRGMDADDFQNYLEVLYGESAIDEYTVEGILMIADMYDTPVAIRKCEEFLLEKSKKTLKKKFELSVRYNLQELKKQCRSEIKSPNDVRGLDPTLMAELFEKSLASN